MLDSCLGWLFPLTQPGQTSPKQKLGPVNILPFPSEPFCLDLMSQPSAPHWVLSLCNEAVRSPFCTLVLASFCASIYALGSLKILLESSAPHRQQAGILQSAIPLQTFPFISPQICQCLNTTPKPGLQHPAAPLSCEHRIPSAPSFWICVP